MRSSSAREPIVGRSDILSRLKSLGGVPTPSSSRLVRGPRLRPLFRLPSAASLTPEAESVGVAPWRQTLLRGARAMDPSAFERLC